MQNEYYDYDERTMGYHALPSCHTCHLTLDTPA